MAKSVPAAANKPLQGYNSAGDAGKSGGPPPRLSSADRGIDYSNAGGRGGTPTGQYRQLASLKDSQNMGTPSPSSQILCFGDFPEILRF